MLALNHLWSTGLPPEQLAAIGLTLGSDVPVFVAGSSAWAEGRGEHLTPVELPERWFVVIHPRVHVPTAAVFQAPELTRNSPKITMRALFQTGGRSDCESVVRARFPEVADALDWLAQIRRSRASREPAPACSRTSRGRVGRGTRGRTRAGSLDELCRPGFEYLARAGARSAGAVKPLMRWGVAKR